MRRKIFGMICVPLDRNQKARLLHRAQALTRATAPGRHYGALTAKGYAVLRALLMQFHNAGSGRCFPSYKRIQEAVGCSKATVAAALKALEQCGLLSVCNRLVRVRWKDEAALAWRVRVMRTSNCYAFPSKGSLVRSSESKLQGGTGTQVFNPDLFAALDRLKGAFEKANGGRSGQKGRVEA